MVNARRVKLIAESTLKSDRIDAEILARLSRFDGGFLRSVYQRSEDAQVMRTRLRVRSELVRCRARLITSVRGTLRAQGFRVPSCATGAFVGRFSKVAITAELRDAVDPLMETICQLTDQIEVLDRELEELSSSDELMVRLRGVPGVGPVVSVAYVAWMDRQDRFKNEAEMSEPVSACGSKCEDLAG